MDHIACDEFPVFDSLFGSLLIDYALIAINQMLLGLVGEDTLHWLHLVVSAHCGNLGSDVLVQGADLDRSSGSHESFISSEDNIGLFAGGLSSNDDCMAAVGSVAIDVGSEFNFDNILDLEDS
jgi:hypothetical protein